MAGDGQGVTITELGGARRVLALIGRDRPEPVTVAGEQRAVQTWYPGTKTASVQVMGTKEDPIVLRGWFQDPLNVVDGGTQARVALLNGLKQGGRFCRLVWGDRIVRVGRVKRVEVEWHQQERARYSITFEVDAAQEAIALQPLKPASALLGEVRDAIAAAETQTETCLTAVRAVKLIAGVIA